MADTPSFLQAQRLPFTQLMKSCFINASRTYGMAIGILVTIVAVCTPFLWYIREIKSTISTIFNTISTFFQLGWLLTAVSNAGNWLISTIVWFCETLVFGGFTLTQRLLPGVLEYPFLTCRNVTQQVEGKDVILNICDGTELIHFPAWGVMIAIAAILLILVVSAIFLFWDLFRYLMRSNSLIDLKEWNKESFEFLTTATLAAAGLCVFAAVLTGLTHGLLGATFRSAFNTTMAYRIDIVVSIAAWVGLFVFPAWMLQRKMEDNIRKSREEAYEETHRLAASVYWELEDKVKEFLTEPVQMPYLRTVAVLLGTITFLVLLSLGTQLWPSPVGLTVSAVVAFGIVAITLACTLTCYPSLREGLQKLQVLRDEAEAKAAAEGAAKHV